MYNLKTKVFCTFSSMFCERKKAMDDLEHLQLKNVIQVLIVTCLLSILLPISTHLANMHPENRTVPTIYNRTVSLGRYLGSQMVDNRTIVYKG